MLSLSATSVKLRNMTQPSGVPDLRGRRLEQGLTMQQLAQRCTAAGIPVSASEISRIERHIHTPRPALRKKLAELLDLTVADLGSGAA